MSRSREARAIRMIARLGAAMAAFALAGCVTQGTFDEVAAERDALAKREATLAEEVASLEESNAELTDQVDEMRGTYDGLVTELESEVASGKIQIQQLRDGVRLNVSDELLFASGSAVINEGGREVLGRVATQIKGQAAVISVEGHTDNRPIGGALKQRYPTNWELAGARAASVVRLLSEAGIDPAVLRAVSRGPFAPIASNDTADGRAKNRRTEILLRQEP